MIMPTVLRSTASRLAVGRIAPGRIAVSLIVLGSAVLAWPMATLAQSTVESPMSGPGASGPGASGQGAVGQAATGLAPAAGTVPLVPPPVAGHALPTDLSPMGMFMSADWVVKGVMVGLAFASVVTWTVWLAKSLELLAAKRRLGRALSEAGDAISLIELTRLSEGRKGPAAAMVAAAETELRLSEGTTGKEGMKERVASRLDRITAAAGREMTRGTGLLATIGATAPFVGLFGTVWGIMNSFIGISKAQTTNLAVVAPGIAEALLATAIGLVAAIPAVVIYNVFARAITGYKAQLVDMAAAVLRLVSRDLDRVSDRRSSGRHVAAELHARAAE
jgi:biopolymer transport protein ExbB